MSLDLTSLAKAVDALEAAVKVAGDAAFMSKLSREQSDTIRSGVVQSFEFTYELCWKFIQRWLKENQSLEEAALPRTRKDLFRMAARHGLLEDAEPWFEYGDARNMTSHTYDRDKARTVAEVAGRFASDARALLTRLESMHD